jgi:hypothetical protein
MGGMPEQLVGLALYPARPGALMQTGCLQRLSLILLLLS